MSLSLFSGVTNWDELGAQMVAIAGDGMLEPQVRVRRVNQLIDKGVPVDYEVRPTMHSRGTPSAACGLERRVVCRLSFAPSVRGATRSSFRGDLSTDDERTPREDSSTASRCRFARRSSLAATSRSSVLAPRFRLTRRPRLDWPPRRCRTKTG